MALFTNLTVDKLDGDVRSTAVTDAKVDYTTGDLDIEAEIIAAFNTTNGKINSLIAALEKAGILAE